MNVGLILKLTTVTCDFEKLIHITLPEVFNTVIVDVDVVFN